MQKFLARPITAPFFALFGITLVQLGYATFQRGYVRYIPQKGAPQLISPTSNPAVYWALSAGLVLFGVLLIALSAYAAFCLFRAHQAGELTFTRRRNPIGIAMICIAAVFLIAALLAGQCSHR